MSKNESCQISLKDSSFDSVFCVDSESVFCFGLKLLFELENRRIPLKMAMVPVKTTFLDLGKDRKKNDTWRVEGWYDKQNETEYLVPSLTWKN